MANKLEPIGKSSTGMDENIAALVAVVFGWISGLIFFLIEKDSDFVRFHAMQAIIVFVAVSILSILSFLPIIGGLISSLASLGGFILWVLLVVKTYQAEWFELPVVGELAKKYAKIEE